MTGGVGSPTASSLPTPTTDYQSSFPTAVDTTDVDPFCYGQLQDTSGGNDPFVAFNVTEAENAIDALCSKGYILQPGDNPPIYTETYDVVETTDYTKRIYASATWADNQDGCATEGDIALEGDLCSEALGPDFGNCKLTVLCC